MSWPKCRREGCPGGVNPKGGSCYECGLPSENWCMDCYGPKGQSALLLGKPAFESFCVTCGSEKCPECKHKTSSHFIYKNSPPSCDVTWDGSYTCSCKYYQNKLTSEEQALVDLYTD